MEEMRYQYLSLESASQIRLLCLHPNKELLSPHVRCDIVQVDLNAAPLPSYEAMSYVWGSDEKPFRVACGEKRIPVTASLYHALRNLRGKNEIRTIRADGICINQADVQERQPTSLFDGSCLQQCITLFVSRFVFGSEFPKVAPKDIDHTQAS
jgi:hypothetical protein